MRNEIRQKLAELEPRWATVVAGRSYLRARGVVSGVELVGPEEIAHETLLRSIDPLIEGISSGGSYESTPEWDALRGFVRERQHDEGAPDRSAWLEDQVGLAWYVCTAWSGSGDATKACRDCLQAAWSNMDLISNDSKDAGWVGPALGELELRAQLSDIDRVMARGDAWPEFHNDWPWMAQAANAFQFIWRQ